MNSIVFETYDSENQKIYFHKHARMGKHET